MQRSGMSRAGPSMEVFYETWTDISADNIETYIGLIFVYLLKSKVNSMNFLFEFRPQVCAQSEPTNQVQIEN